MWRWSGDTSAAGVSGPEFCGDLVCGFRKIVGKSNFLEQFGGLVDRCEGVGVAWMLCGGLRAWLSAQSLLMAVHRSLIARRRFGPRARWQPLRGTLASGLGLDGMSLAWAAIFGCWFSFVLACSAVGHGY